MQWIDEKKRIFGIVHWVDLLVIVASLLVIVKVGSSFWPDFSGRERSPIRITLVSSDLRPEVVQGIRPGEWLKDARTGVILGTVIEKKAVPHISVRWDGDRPVKVTDNERLDIQLTLEQRAIFKKNEGAFIGPLALRVGRKGSFFTADSEFYGEVIRVAKMRTDSLE